MGADRDEAMMGIHRERATLKWFQSELCGDSTMLMAALSVRRLRYTVTSNLWLLVTVICLYLQ